MPLKLMIRGGAGRGKKMKYGGQGGWKAVKRLKRDANVAAGRSPYGGGKHSSAPEPLGPVGFVLMTLIFLITIPIAAMWWLFELVRGWFEKRSAQQAELDLRAALEATRTEAMVERFPGQCEVITKRGTRCRNKAAQDGRCGRHQLRN
jgi:hypothetical protein